MSRYHSYLRSAETILNLYDGSEPFAGWLKRYFAQYKKFGSGDRRQVSRLCYAYFRCGRLHETAPVEARILLGIFLCSQEPDPVLAECKPEWNAHILDPLDEKLKLTGRQEQIRSIFSFKEPLSAGVDATAFTLSHLQQPDLFIRIRPGHADKVLQALQKALITFQQVAPHTLAIPNSSKVDTVLEPDVWAVVQDYNSQRIAEFLPFAETGKPLRVWDCCAGSGGKSLLVFDNYPQVDLTVSDRREQILVNLSKRFRAAGIRQFHAFTADLTKPLEKKPGQFDLILADVPCSGSGTWGRTPEQLLYFDEKKVAEYAALQKQIAGHAAGFVKPGGYLLYSTCSVFESENEAVVEYLSRHYGLNIQKSGLLSGLGKKADSLYAALLQKPL